MNWFILVLYNGLLLVLRQAMTYVNAGLLSITYMEKSQWYLKWNTNFLSISKFSCKNVTSFWWNQIPVSVLLLGLSRWQHNCCVRSLPIYIYPDAATTVTRQDSPYTSHLPFVLIVEALFSGIYLSTLEKRIVGIFSVSSINQWTNAMLQIQVSRG